MLHAKRNLKRIAVVILILDKKLPRDKKDNI